MAPTVPVPVKAATPTKMKMKHSRRSCGGVVGSLHMGEGLYLLMGFGGLKG